MAAAKKEGFVIRSFNVGETASYTGGTIESFPEGEFGNYEAAGIVRVPTDEDRAFVKGGPGAKKAPPAPTDPVT